MKKILIVVDMQNDFIDGALGSAQAQAIVSKAVQKVRQYVKDGDIVIFTRDTHYEDYLDTQEGKNLPVRHCIKNTYGWAVTDMLETGNALIWDKNTFGSPELAAYIKEKMEADEIELIGLCTDICVVSNALILKAFLPETKITVDADCCAGISNESHAAALLTMKICHVNVTNWV